MKRFLLGVIYSCAVALFYNNAYGAMLNDSLVVVLAQWAKNERHVYRYSQYEYVVTAGDTIINSRFNRDFEVVVDDSTEHLFSLKFSRLTLPSQADSIAIDEVPLRLMTNRNGALIKVLNWDAYLAWRDNDVELTSDDLMPFVSMLSFNGKKLHLGYDYQGSQIIPGNEIERNDSVKSTSRMSVTRDFINSGEYGLITINTITRYFTLDNDSPLPIFDKFTQIVDSEKGWTMATYSERRRKTANGENVTAWTIKLLD